MRKYSGFLVTLIAFFCFTCGTYAAQGYTAADLKKAPDFQLPDLNDKVVSLSDYKDKQAVVLFFWTTWCPYCRTELKRLNAEFAGLEKASVAVLAINIGEPKYKVENFVQSRNLGFTVLLDRDSLVAEIYDLLGVPAYFVINSAGQIVSMGSRFPGDILKELAGKHSK
ncbi:MAG: peroxiredoxin family protein [Candidatus Omnitrophota bacterium]|jgi:peroxiredoxin|nr:peroxiredoxin family protein [Candidatus Omnitrophota bacterium]MDD5518535.1 peroxiredoxin family protein [Candidatus Omnitrophota bacterium]